MPKREKLIALQQIEISGQHLQHVWLEAWEQLVCELVGSDSETVENEVAQKYCLF